VNPSTTRTVFRTLAIAEAASWALLLVAMFCKWILESEPFGLEEGGVPKAGMLHGIVFVFYIASALLAAFVFRWNLKTTVLALAASIPPLFTIWFETAADRRGLLTAPKDRARSTI
jgi:integral membrane protein